MDCTKLKRVKLADQFASCQDNNDELSLSPDLDDIANEIIVKGEPELFVYASGAETYDPSKFEVQPLFR